MQNTKDFLESLLVGQGEEADISFNDIMAEKLSDALEVRKVEIASGIMDEATMKDDYKSYTGKGNHRPGWMLRADPELKKRFDDAKKRNAAKKKALGSPSAGTSVKEEFEQIDEADGKLTAAHKERISDFLKKSYGDKDSEIKFSNHPVHGHSVDYQNNRTGMGYSHRITVADGKVKMHPAHMSSNYYEDVNHEEVELDEASGRSIVDNLKSRGKHEEAGAAAHKHGLGRKYGQHFGMRDTYDRSEAAFHRGYDKAELRRKYAGETEKLAEVAEGGSTDTAKQLALHKRNLQVMNMAPTERSRVMTALKTHMNGRRLNMNQSSALLGYLGKAGGLGDVNSAVRNKVLKQGSAKKDEV